MREIKFRGRQAFGTGAGTWIYGNIFFENQQACDDGYVVKIATTGGLFVYVDPETVGQFTGRQDSLDTGIYEADCVLLESASIIPAIVCWSEVDSGFELLKPGQDDGDGWPMGEFEDTQVIIGNSHEGDYS